MRDKSAWKFFVSVKGTRRAMKRLLVKRFKQRTATRILALEAALPVLKVLAMDGMGMGMGEGWEPEVNNVDPFHLRVPEGNAVGSGEELTRVLRAPKDRSSWRLRPQTGCTSVGCQVQRTTEVSMCWSCGHVYCCPFFLC